MADGSVRRLEPSYIRADAVSWWILVGVISAVGAVGLVVSIVASGTPWVWAVVLVAWLGGVVASIVGALRWPAVAWRHASYVVHPHGIEIRQGVLWRRITSVPKSRVQHTDVIQGPVLRRYGLATLTIHTAGTEAAVVALSGLSRESALEVRDFLLSEKGRDGV